jgi:glucosamine-6-phosphate deaminase
MRVIIEQDYESMSRWAAEHVIERINSYKPEGGRKFVLGLPTGSSPEGMYRALAEACAQGRVSFRNVVTFNMESM